MFRYKMLARFFSVVIISLALLVNTFTVYAVEPDVVQSSYPENENQNLNEFFSRPISLINMAVRPNSITPLINQLYLNTGQRITFSLDYSPVNADIALVVEHPNGSLGYIIGNNGSIDYMLVVGQRGEYNFYIVNNSSVTVTLRGYAQW